jgi:hypothetical protein
LGFGESLRSRLEECQIVLDRRSIAFPYIAVPCQDDRHHLLAHSASTAFLPKKATCDRLRAKWTRGATLSHGPLLGVEVDIFSLRNFEAASLGYRVDDHPHRRLPRLFVAEP